jgi:hypothetical protein
MSMHQHTHHTTSAIARQSLVKHNMHLQHLQPGLSADSLQHQASPKRQPPYALRLAIQAQQLLKHNLSNNQSNTIVQTDRPWTV